jgi:hypothetical protein
MALKINQAFVRGFSGEGDGKLCAPLTVVGDDDELVLRKGKGFDEWLADTTGIVHANLKDETPYNEMNIQVLNAIVRGWLYGVEYEG